MCDVCRSLSLAAKDSHALLAWPAIPGVVPAVCPDQASMRLQTHVFLQLMPLLPPGRWERNLQGVGTAVPVSALSISWSCNFLLPHPSLCGGSSFPGWPKWDVESGVCCSQQLAGLHKYSTFLSIRDKTKQV